MDNKIQIFRYNGNDITFQSGDRDTMVNATQMAKPFGKFSKDWLKTDHAKEFIKCLSDRRKILPSDLVRVINGNGGGTWFHEDVAIEFARWLSPDFTIWCNDRIKEIFRYGFSATENTLEKIQANPDIIIQLATALKQEREEHMAEFKREKERHQAELQEEKDYSFKTAFDLFMQTEKTFNAKKEIREYKEKAKGYLFIADGLKHLLKENNIRIPGNLLLYKEDYDFLNEKDPDTEAFMKKEKNGKNDYKH